MEAVSELGLAARWLARPLGVTALVLAGPTTAQEAAKATPEDRWVVSVTAYAWAPSVEGHTRVGGQKADVDMPFADMLEDLTFGAMGMVAARRGRFGFYVNPFFARTRSDEGGGSHGLSRRRLPIEQPIEPARARRAAGGAGGGERHVHAHRDQRPARAAQSRQLQYRSSG